MLEATYLPQPNIAYCMTDWREACERELGKHASKWMEQRCKEVPHFIFYKHRVRMIK